MQCLSKALWALEGVPLPIQWDGYKGGTFKPENARGSVSKWFKGQTLQQVFDLKPRYYKGEIMTQTGCYIRWEKSNSKNKTRYIKEHVVVEYDSSQQ